MNIKIYYMKRDSLIARLETENREKVKNDFKD